MPQKAKNSSAKSRRSSSVESRQTKPTKKAVPQEESWFDLIRQIRLSESYISLLLGIVVVIILAVLVITTARSLRQKAPTQSTSSTSTVATIQPTQASAATPTSHIAAVTATTQPMQPTVTPRPTQQPVKGGEYVVKAGDTLWSIAESEYKSGYNWVDIAKANNLTDPSTIHSGNRLLIPKVSPKLMTAFITPSPSPVVEAIKGTTYRIKRGDDLWNIAVRAYGDGYKWVDIAKANHLTNPSLIHADNILTLPR